MPPSTIKISRLKVSGSNPRIIRDDNFRRLKESLQQFPKMMELRQIIVDEKDTVLAGRQRIAALKELGYTEIPREWVKKASELTDEEKKRFMLLDNHHFGEWDYDLLIRDWNLDLMKGWGVDLAFPKEDSTSVSFTAAKHMKGTLLKIRCDNASDAAKLATELIGRGLNVEIK